MGQLELFPKFDIQESERLYIIGNGFDIHHCIDSKYVDFKDWVYNNRKDSNLVGLMDTFFSNNREFWSDIENALGEYDEKSITDFCEPDNPEDFKYEHPGQWQDGIEDCIPYMFGQTMEQFREVFDEWVRSIDCRGIEKDLFIPQSAKYLTFNYTETLEKEYGVLAQNVLHIHGSRLSASDAFVIGHGTLRNTYELFQDETLMLPYQNAYKSVIEIMNEWRKDPEHYISENETFFKSLNNCKGVCVLGLSYGEIDFPYLRAVSNSVASGCKWIMKYYTNEDRIKAQETACALALNDYALSKFE